MDELKGYVQIYTAWAGYQSFVFSGSCYGTITRTGNFQYPIIVPREAVATHIWNEADEENPPEYIHVDLNYEKKQKSGN